MQIIGREKLWGRCGSKCHEVANDYRREAGGRSYAQRRIAVPGKCPRRCEGTAGLQRSETIGCCRSVAVMLTGAATACRSRSLRLQQGQTEPGQKYCEQQAGNWTPHKQRGLYYITVPCDVTLL